MRMALCAVAGLAWLATTGGVPAGTGSSPLHETVDSTALASRLIGHWTGARYDSGSTTPHPFSMQWKKAPDGHLAGMVTASAQKPYETNVVWSSDTGFVTESAPHRSSELNEEVVTRSVAHFKGDSLVGTFELRPMTYRGKSETGKFSATRQK
jgi:hypothetical protein